MKFKVEFLQDVHPIHEAITDIGKWDYASDVIFEYAGKYYRAVKISSNTANQKSLGFGKKGEEQECIEVHQVEKLVKVWEPIKGAL